MTGRNGTDSPVPGLAFCIEIETGKRVNATSGNARKCIFAHSPRTFTIKSALFNAVGKHGEVAIPPDDVRIVRRLFHASRKQFSIE
jgi:hypothetical protein